MVEAARPPVGVPGNDPNAEGNNFHIIHNFFRDRFYKYFEMLQQPSYLVIEDSLYSVIFYLLNPIPATLGVKKYDILTSRRVSHQPTSLISSKISLETYQSSLARA